MDDYERMMAQYGGDSGGGPTKFIAPLIDVILIMLIAISLMNKEGDDGATATAAEEEPAVETEERYMPWALVSVCRSEKELEYRWVLHPASAELPGFEPWLISAVRWIPQACGHLMPAERSIPAATEKRQTRYISTSMQFFS